MATTSQDYGARYRALLSQAERLSAEAARADGPEDGDAEDRLVAQLHRRVFMFVRELLRVHRESLRERRIPGPITLVVESGPRLTEPSRDRLVLVTDESVWVLERFVLQETAAPATTD